jgi:hypothetical protein
VTQLLFQSLLLKTLPFFLSGRCDDINPGYSSPEFFRHVPMRSQAYIEVIDIQESNFPLILTRPIYACMELLKEHKDDREMFNHNLSGPHPHSNQAELEMRYEESNRNVPRRRVSINELSEDEIVMAYNRLQAEQDTSTLNVMSRNESLSVDMKEEFLRWIEVKRKSEKSSSLVTSGEEKLKKAEKVNTIDESEIPDSVVNVVKKDYKNDIEQKREELFDARDDELDEFKDVISDNEENEEEYLKVPLVILEAGEMKLPQNCEKGCEDSSIAVGKTSNVLPQIESGDDGTSESMIEAKMTLSNAPLEVVTSLSASNFSLASDKSGDDTNSKKRPANHTKGRAPPPPAQQSSDVIPVFYYDHVTQKHFKETEL